MLLFARQDDCEFNVYLCFKNYNVSIDLWSQLSIITRNDTAEWAVVAKWAVVVEPTFENIGRGSNLLTRNIKLTTMVIPKLK